jgi:hypothetical protein
MPMTAQQIIREIANLPPAEKAKVMQFTKRIDNGQLSVEELGSLADSLVNAKSSHEADAITEQMVRGFYGHEPHA